MRYAVYRAIKATLGETVAIWFEQYGWTLLIGLAPGILFIAFMLIVRPHIPGDEPHRMDSCGMGSIRWDCAPE